MRSVVIVFLLLSMTLGSCVQVSRPYTELPPGIWRAELQLTEDEVLPFNFEISYDNDDMRMDVFNAEEVLTYTDITFERTKQLEDSLYVSFAPMDSYLKAKLKENVLQGLWVVPNRGDYSIPFVAYHGQGHRFTTDNTAPTTNLTGTWAATFELETDDPYPAIAEFVQQGNDVTGTFITETGDYRYLEGTIQGEELKLSVFDGAHAYLFRARLSSEDAMAGSYLSGKHYETNWVARRDPEAVLTDPYQLTQITTPDKRINFRLKDTNGNFKTLDHPDYAGKPKLITIMGTWCPNCLDESKFLIDYLKRNNQTDLEVIAIAFEKYKDENKALEMIKKYKQRLDLPYDILYGGYYDKEGATEALGFVDEILSYPTLLYIDRTNQVRRVHTGFAGPATSQYQAFIEEFESTVADLIVE
ncbi:MAG: TlpA disulfide reductase family protein [Bacteroidota bacterium]